MAAKRVFVSISSKSKHWAQAYNSAESAVNVALDLIKQRGLVPQDVDTPRLLIEDKFGSRTHIVFDILHDSYRSETAHLPDEGHLPVIAVWLGTRESVQTATQGLRNKVNDEVRQWHTLMGAERNPPFFFDRSGGAFPIFMDPQAAAVELVHSHTNIQ
ncbi:hypothetical protein HIM_11177 [Hirsutella minnesotensis 3608]|uniref:Uncharacterized protein n=1 Tax=Hirsutella minnesotensis 3608 TaxID=1043627 RepID=A0A0F7ZWR4_9HYPO|nr:hypothetical protein HIM_11177 [Hirsutella minnesotensis 3608]